MKNLLTAFIFFSLTTAYAQNVQWASKVLEFSSELSTYEYSASQVLGKPNVAKWGDNPNAWLPETPDKVEYIKVALETPMKIRQIAISESYNPSSVYKIFIYSKSGKEELIDTFVPKPIGLKGRMLNIFISETEYEVAAIKLVTNGTLVPGYSGIDAIGVSDSNEPIEVKIEMADNLTDSIPTIRLSSSVNSNYQESRPLIAPDGKTLFFTRKNHPENMGGENDPEDIWYSEFNEESKEWEEAKNMGAPLNNANSNFISSITPDGKSMVVLLGNKYKKGDKMKPGISISSKTANGWTEPEDVNIEKAFFETLDGNFVLSNDREILVMAVNRYDARGGKDLYVSFRINGNSWSEPLNLGTTLNTAHDEYSPYLAPDNETLYFSSKGFSGFGGSDIYITRRLDDSWTKWSAPENLGPDINSEEDETFFNMTPSGKQAYFTKGTGGNADLFRIDIPIFYQPSPVLTVIGSVLDKDTKTPLEAQIIFTLMPEKTQVGISISDSNSGEYKIVLPTGAKYIFSASADGYKTGDFEINLMEDLSKKDYERILYLTKVPMDSVAPMLASNKNTSSTTNKAKNKTTPSSLALDGIYIRFGFDKNELSSTSLATLKQVIQQLSNYKGDATITISGHTDSVGSEFYNLSLSQRRAKAVYDYLLKQGISADIINYKGFGEKQPIANNTIKEGRAQNRRVEFQIK